MLTRVPDVQEQVHEVLESCGHMPTFHALQLLVIKTKYFRTHMEQPLSRNLCIQEQAAIYFNFCNGTKRCKCQLRVYGGGKWEVDRCLFMQSQEL